MTETLAAGTATGTEEVPAIRLRKLTKVFGDTVAVNAVDLDIRHGEFFSMLGPSGSGKTTVLRLIAGFELPTSGTIELEGKDVTSMAPFQRDVNPVFQDYALFPHMSLVDNVAYGLRVRGMPGNQRRERAREALDRVQLGKFLGRKPAQLSGGPRQRVAFARAASSWPTSSARPTFSTPARPRQSMAGQSRCASVPNGCAWPGPANRSA